MSEPDHIVVRGTNSKVDGRWYDRATFSQTPVELPEGVLLVILEATGEFEVRDDGAVAEVWRPVSEGTEQ